MTSAIWWGIFGFGLVVLLGRRVSAAVADSLALSTVRLPVTHVGHAGWRGSCPTTSMTRSGFSARTTPRNVMAEQRRAAFGRLSGAL